MIIKAGNFSTSISHTASIPNSGNSKIFIFLIESKASFAAAPPMLPR